MVESLMIMGQSVSRLTTSFDCVIGGSGPISTKKLPLYVAVPPFAIIPQKRNFCQSARLARGDDNTDSIVEARSVAGCVVGD